MQIGGIPTVTHYLDDYFFVASTEVLSQANLESAIHLCEYLGVPLAVTKMVGPSTLVTYLGIQIDSASLTISLPENKLIKLVNLLAAWDAKLTCTKWDLLSLVGSLSFACKVVKPGCTFLRCLIDLSTTQSELQGILLLDEEARADIKWWRDFIRYWNGKEIIQPQPVTSVDLGLYTDASNVGMGGVSGNKWFYCAREKSWGEKHINIKELFAIVTAIFAWGKEWRDMSVVLYTDNKPITQIWHTGATKNKEMMCLIR